MEETKIWSIEEKSAKQLDTTKRMETEGLLEDILTANPDMLEEGLQLVGRQTSTAGGPLDLLGVDSDGALVVFELKRGTLNREAVSQTIDYASDLNAMDLEVLADHIEQQSGNLGIEKIENFVNWYSKLRESYDLPEGGLESLIPPRMVLVGLGVDDTTERMVQFMASGGMDISLLTFHGFLTSDGKTLLARNVEVDSANVPVNPTRRSSSRNQIAQFEDRAAEIGMLEILNGVREMFRKHFDYKAHYASRHRMRFNRDKHSYFFIEIDEDQKCLNVGFHPRAVDLAIDEFNQLEKGNIPSERSRASVATPTDRVNYEVRFPIYSLAEWNAHKGQLIDLTKSIFSEYQKSRSS